ncbi:MAG: tRNA (guanosine(37)-N1)-methyltransferase TrmD [Deltaproteobacteria bacterium]|nr:tRNA (guanosine(37)-N1)-methyltransferase TrmD [Deltaproteobacteria bacterium]
MRVTFLTLFPELIEPVVSTSILGRARESGAFVVESVQLRDFSTNKHRTVDDSPAGGGAGMVIRVDVVVGALESVLARNLVPRTRTRVVLPDARGRPFSQSTARAWSTEVEHLVFICGRYEGIDARVHAYVDDVVSTGDIVLTGGELPALLMTDAVVRLLPGVLGNAESSLHESHGDDGLLEHRHYTRPVEFRDQKMPAALSSGNHALIARARAKDALLLTRRHRPDLFVKRARTKGEQKLLDDERVPGLDPE